MYVVCKYGKTTLSDQFHLDLISMQFPQHIIKFSIRVFRDKFISNNTQFINLNINYPAYLSFYLNLLTKPFGYQIYKYNKFIFKYTAGIYTYFILFK